MSVIRNFALFALIALAVGGCTSTTSQPSDSATAQTATVPVTPVAAAVPPAAAPAPAPVMPSADALVNIGWSMKNDGGVDCPEQYVVTYPECIPANVGRGRKCMMGKAIASAKANDCANAMRVTLITQCHNPHAQDVIRASGQDAVCNFLRVQ